MNAVANAATISTPPLADVADSPVAALAAIAPEDASALTPKPTVPAPATIRQARDELAERRRRVRTRIERDTQWRPNHSAPYREMDLELKTDIAQRMVSLALISAQRYLYQIYQVLPSTGKGEASTAIETLLTTRLKNTAKKLDNAIAQVTVVAKDAGSEPVARYTDTQHLTWVIYTPEAGRFAGLLLKLDKLTTIVDALWFDGQYTRQQRAEILLPHRSAIGRLARELYMLLMRTRRAADRARSMREQALARRLERDRRKRDADVACEVEAAEDVAKEAAASTPEGAEVPSDEGDAERVEASPEALAAAQAANEDPKPKPRARARKTKAVDAEE